LLKLDARVYTHAEETGRREKIRGTTRGRIKRRGKGEGKKRVRERKRKDNRTIATEKVLSQKFLKNDKL